jgi:diphthamide biosynthesis protein 7
VTLSDGVVALCRSSDGGPDARPWSSESTVAMTELATHSLEPWTLAFSPDAELLFSGGDDAVLQALRLPSIDGNDNDAGDDGNAATLLWSDRKSHEAGVTSILPLVNDLLITGSYDDRIRLLSAPVVGRRKVLAELDLGGGVWRLKMLGKRYVISFFFLIFPHPQHFLRFSIFPVLVKRMQGYYIGKYGAHSACLPACTVTCLPAAVFR